MGSRVHTRLGLVTIFFGTCTYFLSPIGEGGGLGWERLDSQVLFKASDMDQCHATHLLGKTVLTFKLL